MAGDWRRLALAALAAAAVAVVCARPCAEAPAPAKAARRRLPRRPMPSRRRRRGRCQERQEKSKQDPAEAQRRHRGGVKVLEAGKSDQAAQSLTTVLNGGNLPPAIMAKALLYRGIAYRQQKTGPSHRRPDERAVAEGRPGRE